MASTSYSTWSNAWNKDELKFYDNEEFRSDYTQLEMAGKARMFKDRALEDITSALKKISSQTYRHEIRILSLGCGPGSDLLGVLGAANDALRSGGMRWGPGQLRCVCTGVDAFEWDRHDFSRRINGTDFGFLRGQIECGFVHEDMDKFVLSYLRDNRTTEFDFISLSFADAGRNLELIGTALPQLLSEFGRILVLDNDIPTVRSLTNYGFTCTFVGYNFCMHSRGRGSYAYRVSYRPSADSPIQKYRRQKRQEAQGTARLVEQSSEGLNYNVYQYDRRETSWCERTCSIL